MAEKHGKTPAIDGLQGASALFGITLGLIPLVRWVLQREHGAIFRWMFGDPSGSMAYAVPLVVIVATIGFIAALEGLKRRA